jgi:hypothetical protein
LQIEFVTFAAKKPQPLCETWIEKGIGETGIVWPQAHNAQYNAQGAAPLHSLCMNQVKCKRYDNMRNT